MLDLHIIRKAGIYFLTIRLSDTVEEEGILWQDQVTSLTRAKESAKDFLRGRQISWERRRAVRVIRGGTTRGQGGSRWQALNVPSSFRE